MSWEVSFIKTAVLEELDREGLLKKKTDKESNGPENVVVDEDPMKDPKAAAGAQTEVSEGKLNRT